MSAPRAIRAARTSAVAFVASLGLAASPAGAVYEFEAKRDGFEAPRGIAVNEHGEVFVADNGFDQVLKLDSGLGLIEVWGSEGSADGEFDDPWGIEAVGEEVFVADFSNDRVQVLDRTGGFLRKWDADPPVGVGVNSFGEVFVTPTTEPRVQKFDLEGNLLEEWGSEGSGDGQFGNFIAPDIGIGLFGSPWVPDPGNNRVQLFSRFGSFVSKFRANNAAGIAIDAATDLYVTDCEQDLIRKFDNAGDLIRTWGVSGSANGRLDCPTSIEVDSAGNVYVSDFRNDRVQKFRHVAPRARITAGPSGLTTDRTLSFEVDTDDRFADLYCRLDARPFEPCASPERFIFTGDGAHTFQVRAVDEVGFGTVAERSFEIDTAAPETAIDAGPSALTADPTPAFAFSSPEPGVTFECAVDNVAFEPCTSPVTLEPLADGAHTFFVRALDPAGNADPTPARRAFTVDTSPPGGGNGGGGNGGGGNGGGGNPPGGATPVPCPAGTSPSVAGAAGGTASPVAPAGTASPAAAATTGSPPRASAARRWAAGAASATS